MKRFTKGEVWLYSPTSVKVNKPDEKRSYFEKDLCSPRPVIIVRELDDESPYGDVGVVPCTTKPVPYMEFPVNGDLVFGMNTVLKAKPYEYRTINIRHLMNTRYFGRLSDDEFERLYSAVTRYIDGEPIDKICDEASLKAYRESDRYKTNTRQLLEDDMYSTLINRWFTSKESPCDSGSEKPEFDDSETPNVPVPETPAPKGARFEVPTTMGTLRKVCKTYCGTTKPSIAVISMVQSVPLKDADAIINMGKLDIMSKYHINDRAAGAVRLLAIDYVTNGYKFSWKDKTVNVPSMSKEKEAEDKKETKVPSSSATPITPTPPATPETARRISFNQHHSTKVVVISDEEIEERINKVRYFLADKTMKYATDEIIELIFSVPTTDIEKAYSGKAFNLNYSGLCKRMGEDTHFKVIRG